jgi:uncharacterized protein YjgD (DUF1641 family)
MTEAQITSGPTIEELNRKIDLLTSQVAILTEEALRQRDRQQEWDDLKADLLPVSNEAFLLAVQQLEEVEQCVRLENILHFLKQLARNTCNFRQALDQMESLMAFWEDFGPLSRDVFLNLMNRLDEMERKGYFEFLQEVLAIGDDVVTSFSREDMQNLRQTVIPMLEMVKELAQPEVVERLQRSVTVLKQEEPRDASLFTLVGQLNDPSVRRGLAKSLHALKAIAE